MLDFTEDIKYQILLLAISGQILSFVPLYSDDAKQCGFFPMHISECKEIPSGRVELAVPVLDMHILINYIYTTTLYIYYLSIPSYWVFWGRHAARPVVNLWSVRA